MKKTCCRPEICMKSRTCWNMQMISISRYSCKAGRMNATYRPNKAFAVTLPYMPVIASSVIGLSGSAFGIIIIFQKINFIFVNPLIGYVTDYFNKLKFMMVASLYLYVVCFTILLIIPPIRTEMNEFHISNFSSCKLHKSVYNNDKQFVEMNSYGNNDKTYFSHENRTFETIDIDFNASTIDEYSCREKFDLYFDNISHSLICFQENSTTSDIDMQLNYPGLVTSLRPSTKTFFCCRNSEKYYIISCDISNNTIDSKKISEFATYQFWASGLCITLGLTGMNLLVILSDTACCEIVKKNRGDYGRQRLYNSLGMSIMVITSGVLYDYIGNYWVDFTLMWILSTITAINLNKMDLMKPKIQKNSLKNIKTVLVTKEFVLFFFSVLINGMGMCVTRFYHILFLTTIGASRLLCSLVICFQRFIEVPFMFFSGYVIKKLGHFYVLSICLLAYSLRYLCLSYLYNPWIALPIELFNGVSGGLYFPTAVSFAKMKAEPGIETTIQSVVFVIFSGFGMGLGSAIFGWGFDVLGNHQVFFYSSLFIATWAILLTLLTLWMIPKSGQLKNPKAAPNNNSHCNDQENV